MKKLQEEAKRFLEEDKYNLIMLSEWCHSLCPPYSMSDKVIHTPILLFLAISALAQGSTDWRIQDLSKSLSLDGMDAAYLYSFIAHSKKGPHSAADMIEDFLKIEKYITYHKDIKDIKDIKEHLELQKKFNFYADKLNKDFLPHFYNIKEEKNLPTVVFTDYPPSVEIFLAIYQQDRNNHFFKSTGLYSRFFRGDKEMHLRRGSEVLTFAKVLEYGVKYPKSRTANILQKYFKTYWDEAIDNPLKVNLSQKNNVLDGFIISDLQPIVRDYLFSP